jgi:DNA replication protein DnaD
MCGYFKIWRELFDKPIWLNSTPEQKVVLISIIKMANWKENKWEWNKKTYHCKAGEFVTSYSKICETCGKGLTHQNVRTALKRFQNLEFLTYQTTVGVSGGIKVIINNWDKYQNETNTLTNTLPTDYQQNTNTFLTTIEEIKKDKKERSIFLEKKVDPFFNSVKEVYVNQYEKIFGKKPYLTLNECNKLLELDESIENFAQTIPTALERLKKIKFKDIDFIPSSSWLLKENNYTKILNGEFEKSEDKTSHLQAVLERMRARNNG